MCHLSRSHNPTLLGTFLKWRIPLRSWSQYQREKTLRKLNSYRRMMTLTMTITVKKKKAMRLKAKMMRITLP
jgi:hypothetical protein